MFSSNSKRAETRVSLPSASTLLVPLPPIPVGSGGMIPGSVYPKFARSPGHLVNEDPNGNFDRSEADQISNSANRLKCHFYGNNRSFALIGETSWISADIDVHPDINFEYTPDANNPKNVFMHVTGSVSGDQFPDTEAFVIDKNDNGVMLGVWAISEGDGPVISKDWWFGIEGDKNLLMFDIDVTIYVEDGIFTKAIKDGKIISLEEHNQYYINLPTVKPRN